MTKQGRVSSRGVRRQATQPTPSRARSGRSILERFHRQVSMRTRPKNTSSEGIGSPEEVETAWREEILFGFESATWSQQAYVKARRRNTAPPPASTVHRHWVSTLAARSSSTEQAAGLAGPVEDVLAAPAVHRWHRRFRRH